MPRGVVYVVLYGSLKAKSAYIFQTRGRRARSCIKHDDQTISQQPAVYIHHAYFI